MTRFFYRWSALVIFLLVGLGMVMPWSHAGANLDPRKDKIVNKLDSIVLKRIEFDETPLKNVIEYLIAQSRAEDPSGDGVNILLKFDPEKMKDSAKALTVSMNLRNVTLKQAIKFLTQVTDLRYKIEADCVLIGTVADFPGGRTETRIFRVAPGAFPSEVERTPESSFGEKSFGPQK